MKLCALLLGVVAILHGARSAHADAGIVIEVDDGARPRGDDPALQPLHTELARRGLLDGAALAAQIDAKLSRASGTLTGSQVVAAQQDVDLAYQRFIDGDYASALASANRALAQYAPASAQLAHEPALRDIRFKALVIAARSSEVLDKGEDAFAFMAEAVRSFPDRPISGTEFDPNVRALQRRVKDELAKQGTGVLDVEADDTNAVIFVDEQFVGTGTARLASALPGRYRVYVASGDQVGRVREIDVAPGAHVAVSVPWSVEKILRTAPGSVALASDGRDPAAVVAAAGHLARALGASRVIVVAVRPIDGRRSVIGYAVTVESQTRLFAAVQLEPVPPTAATIAHLAALLAGDKSASPTGLITKEPVWSPPPVTTHALGRQRKLAIGIGALAVAAGATGLGFELSSRSTYRESQAEWDDARQEALYQSANRKYEVAQAFAIGAAACAIGAVTLWLTADAPSERPTLVIAPTAGGASFAVEGSF